MMKRGTRSTTTGNIWVIPRNFRSVLEPRKCILVREKAARDPMRVVKKTVATVTFKELMKNTGTLYLVKAKA